MIAFQIKERNDFMHKLLAADCFDSFLLEEASVAASCTYEINGHLNQAFYSREEWEDPDIRPYDLSPWKDMRGLCYNLIKGRRTPVSFKFVLHLMPEYVATLMEKGNTSLSPAQVKAFVITIKYDGSMMMLITGTALRTFLPDKSPDQIWDTACKSFLLKKGIAFDEL